MVSYSSVIGTPRALTKNMATKILEVTTAIILIVQVIAVSSSADKCEIHCGNSFGGGDLCITADLICDHFPDCKNGEDEAPEMCACKGFTCVSNGFCLEAAYRCDGYESCFDKSDEVNCTKDDYKLNFPSLPDEDLCKRPCGRHGSCSFASDGRAVCLCNEGYSGAFCEVEDFKEITSTQTPEEEEEMFACDRKEISMKLHCNGLFECADKTDEMNCTLEDYEKTKPHLEKRFLCLMPCQRTSCAFDGSGRAHCPCPENSEGVFCESLTRSSTQPLSLPTASYEDATVVSTFTQSPSKPQESNEEVAVESSSIFTTIVLPIFAIAGLALGLWLWLSKPWTSGGSMTRPLV